MGEQKSTLTVNAAGGAFTGSNNGPMGAIEIPDGVVDGDTLIWSSKITSPMPMKIDCKATITGDSVAGSVTAGMFGTFPMTGTRVG